MSSGADLRDLVGLEQGNSVRPESFGEGNACQGNVLAEQIFDPLCQKPLTRPERDAKKRE